MLTPYTLLLIMTLILFLLGLATFITGVLILALRAPGREIQTLATQTTRLAQKGLAQEVSGLVGNASSLLSVINQLVLTTSGVGAFITLLGLLIMGAACWLAFKIFQVPL